MARIWSEESKLETWLRVELAALDAWAEVGVVPEADVRAIRERAVTPSPERVAEIERVTDHDTAAFVDAAAEQLGPEGRWIHYGLTSSDVVDTALALQIQAAGRLVVDGVDAAFAAVVRRAEEHRRTVTIGRSHGVHAEPTTFGWKLAGWAFELDRDRARLARALESNRVGQLSGTVGTYAAVDPEVERIVVGQNGIRGVDPVVGHVCIRVGFQQPQRQSQAFPHPSPVPGRGSPPHRADRHRMPWPMSSPTPRARLRRGPSARVPASPNRRP